MTRDEIKKWMLESSGFPVTQANAEYLERFQAIAFKAGAASRDAEIADLLEANRIACEDLVEQQNLRVKYAGQIAELVAALERIGKYPRVSGDELGYEGCRAVAREALAKVRKP